jgi:predicted AlkP superfamily phosphohydrolase/phosphomutase
MRAKSQNNHPLVIIGVDAGDSRLLRQWSCDGTLPALGSVMRRGCWGRTTGPELISEHGMWVTLTSGISRRDHGYYYHRQLVPGTYRLAPVRGRELGVEPFWVGLKDHARVAVIDVPDVAAPQPQPGIQLSEWATHSPYFPPSAHPPAVLTEARRVFGRQMLVDEEPMSAEPEDRTIFRRLRDRVDKKIALCRRLLAEGEFDLIWIVFGECHTGGHQLWKYLPESQRARTGPGTLELKDGLRDLYEATDRGIGEILRQAGDDANVFVISSVGMKSQYPAAGLGEAFCRQLGYQADPPPSNARANGPMALLRRALPRSVRDQASRLLPRTLQERWISDKFEFATDWDRTVAFCIPSYYTSFLRVNLQGREPRGIVTPGAEYEQVLDRIEQDLALLIDPVTAKPAVQYVARATDLFGGAPPETLPDLFVEWAEADHFMERLEHPRTELRQTPCEFHRGSDHSRCGFVAAAGPGIAGRSNIGDISPLDLVPTFLRLLQATPGTDLAGRPHTGILGELS